MIELTKVTKLYGTVIGVNEIDLVLEPGAYGLLGANGSGKTTLINLLTGQLKPSVGAVRIFQSDPWAESNVRYRLGLCPATDILYTNVTAFQFVRFLLELQGINRSDSAELANNALDVVGLDDKDRNRPMGEYSRGMKQRAKLAQAIAHDPELLILDEPFSGLDPVARHEMTTFLQDWVTSGKSVVVSSHILHEVENIAQHYLLMNHGRLLAHGSTTEIRDLLADIPREVTLRCTDAVKLAGVLQYQECVESVGVLDGNLGVIVRSTDANSLFDALPNWITEHELNVTEVESSDESLNWIFDTLLKMHQGEI